MLEELEEQNSMCKFLIDWNAQHKITCEAMKDLLSGLRILSHPRTLLHTNLAYSTEDSCGGSCVYLWLAKSMQSVLSKVHNISLDSNTELHLQFNIDENLTAFNNSMQCIWIQV